MTTDLLEVIREALEKMNGGGVFPFHGITAENALAALEMVRSNYLPLELLPDGWVLSCIQNHYKYTGQAHSENEQYACRLFCQKDGVPYNKSVSIACGATPNAAFLAARKQIGDV